VEHGAVDAEVAAGQARVRLPVGGGVGRIVTVPVQYLEAQLRLPGKLGAFAFRQLPKTCRQ